MKHKLYETGDEDCPDIILDRNGEVVLALCKICGKGEGELFKECPGPALHKTFVTFGQAHAHVVNGNTFDRNCVAVIKSAGPAEGRKLAFDYFGPKFCFEYPEEFWDEKLLRYFPRGYIEVN